MRLLLILRIITNFSIMIFSDFIGNEKIKNQLTYLQQSNRLPHAIIIEGEEGLGKHVLAREIALNLFCRAENPPCRNCPQCSKVLKGIHPDVYEFTATGAKNSFKVDDVRNIIEDAYVRPNEADYKVFILGNCQGMNANAQNALLKILEEPPSYVLFILTTTTKSAMLETVLSRSVVMSVEGVEPSRAAEYICSKDAGIDYADALNAATIWNGNIGKAIESLKDGMLSKIAEITGNICTALVADKEYDLLKACSVFENDRDMLITSLTMMKSVLRDSLMYNKNADMLSGQEDIVRLLASRLSRDKTVKLIDACDRVRALAEKNGNRPILITKLCYELRRAQCR